MPPASPTSQSPNQADDAKKRGGRRKKFTPLRTDLPIDPNQPAPAINPETKTPQEKPSENKAIGEYCFPVVSKKIYNFLLAF